jgi:hypothetical protein
MIENAQRQSGSACAGLGPSAIGAQIYFGTLADLLLKESPDYPDVSAGANCAAPLGRVLHFRIEFAVHK